MKHINESIIGKRGSIQKAVRNWDVLEIEDRQSRIPCKCHAIYLDNKTARVRKKEIIDLCFRDRSQDTIKQFNDTLDENEGIIILYRPEDRRFYCQNDSFYEGGLTSIPTDHINSTWGITFVVTRIAGHVKDTRGSLNSIFSYNNYFRDL